MQESETGGGIGTEQSAFRPWRFWSTLGLSLAIGILAVLSQIVFSVVWVVALYLREGSIDAARMVEDGNFLMGCTLFSYPFVLGFMALFIKVRRGNTLADYLRFRATGFRSVMVWVGWFCGFLVLTTTASFFFDQPPPAISVMLVSTTHAGLLFLTLAVAAPVAEELFFRGFMFRGIAASRLGHVGAVALTTFFWVAIHGFQYGLPPLLYLTLLGVLLGMARAKTGSTMVPVILHVANNVIAVSTLKILSARGLL